MTAPTSGLDSVPLNSASLTCPACAHAQRAEMPQDACVFFYACDCCGKLHKPRPGDCCVFCSYGDAPCPPVQAESGAGESCC
ncbi:MAG: GDCCVxC domain-containing (seleno)protein [Deinococcus sp.]